MYVFGKNNNSSLRHFPRKAYTFFIWACIMAFCACGFSQKADSIFFNPYTDSLKKGTFNYINVEGRLPNGRFIPMTSRDIEFSSSTGKFEGNSLFIGFEIPDDRIRITARLKSDSSKKISILLPVKHIE